MFEKEEEESKKKLIKEVLGTWHGRANIGTGRANLLEMEGLARHSQARPCHFKHGPCQGFGHPRLNFFRFLESCLDNYLQKNLKQQKTNKIKAVKCEGCLPRSARFKSLA